MANIKVLKGDITRIEADAIVNAANSSLMGGGGVDGAIHRAGGRAILEECKKIVAAQGELPPGEAVATTAGNLPAKLVIHTVGPVWKGGDNGEAFKLANCYENSLRVALMNGCKTVAFPAISTGVCGYPADKAAEVAIKVIRDFTGARPRFDEIMMVCFDDANYDALTRVLNAQKG